LENSLGKRKEVLCAIRRKLPFCFLVLRYKEKAQITDGAFCSLKYTNAKLDERRQKPALALTKKSSARALLKKISALALALTSASAICARERFRYHE
jgi:hypothetical protein